MGDKYSCVHQNEREISSGKLLRGGPCNPIGVYNFATHEKRYGTSVYGSVKGSLGKLFASFFIWKTEKPLSRCRDYKYVSGRQTSYGTIEPCDIIIREI